MSDREKEFKKEIGLRIRELRRKSGLSMEAFSRQVHSTSATISNIENGKSIPGGTILLNISKAFHVSIDWILKGKEPATYQVREHHERIIFFQNEWQIFCRSEPFLPGEEKKKQERVISIVEKLPDLSLDDLDLIRQMTERLALEKKRISSAGTEKKRRSRPHNKPVDSSEER